MKSKFSAWVKVIVMFIIRGRCRVRVRVTELTVRVGQQLG